MYFQLNGMAPVYTDLPSTPGFMVDVTTDAALLAWFASLSTVIFQAELRPISLIDYAGEALRDLAGSIGQQTPEQRKKLLAAVADQFLGQLGLPSGIGAKVMNREPFADAELAALTAAGGTFKIGEGAAGSTSPCPSLRASRDEHSDRRLSAVLA